MKKELLRVKTLGDSPYLVDLDKVLGKGASATVYQAYNKHNPTQFLVAKVIPYTIQSAKTLLQQTQILKKLQYCKYLVNYKKIKLTSKKFCYFIMQYCNSGSLEQVMNKSKWKVDQEQIYHILNDILKGYAHLIQNNIIHRDLKPQNILVHNKVYKIADFGLSKIIPQDTTMIISCKGSPAYMAPQLFQSSLQSSNKIDIYSLGVIIYRLLHNGSFPYLTQKSYACLSQFLSELMSSALLQKNSAFSNILKRMLQKDPVKRINWNQLFEYMNIKSKQQSWIYESYMVKSSIIRGKMQIVKKSDVKMETYNSDNQKIYQIGLFLTQKREVILFFDSFNIQMKKKLPKYELSIPSVMLVLNNQLFDILNNRKGYFLQYDYDSFRKSQDYLYLQKIIQQDKQFIIQNGAFQQQSIKKILYQEVKNLEKVIRRTLKSYTQGNYDALKEIQCEGKDKDIEVGQMFVYLVEIILYLQNNKSSLLRMRQNWKHIQTLRNNLIKPNSLNLVLSYINKQYKF